jgi:hypothetical protein
MRLRRGGLRQLSAAVQKRDVEPLLGFVRGGPRGVVVQSFVAGQLANCAVACWRGEVLASIAVEVVSSRSHFGVATVVRPVEGSVMKAAARSIVRHLNLSGLCGFDFIIDGVSGQAKLIEINARATQINHMRWGSGLDAAHALGRALGGAMSGVDVEAEPTPAEVLLFPHRPPSDSEGPCFADAGYDLPWEEPELMKFYGAQLSGAARTSIPAASGDAAIDAAESEEPPTSCQIT